MIDMTNTENAKITEGKKENTSSKLLSEKMVGDLKLSKIELYAKDGMVTFTAEVQNTSSEPFEARKVVLVFKDKEGNEIQRVNSYLGNMSANGNNTLSAKTSNDIVNAYDFTIEF